MKINELFENDMVNFFKDLQKNNPKFSNLRVHGDAEHDQMRQQDQDKYMAQQAQDKKDSETRAQQQIEQDRANLPELMKQYQELVGKFNALGGDSYQYADRMTDRDREAQSMHRQVNTLRQRINKAGGGAQESATGGATSTGSGATAPGRRRPDSILA